MEIKIEKSVPLPDTMNARYPIRDMLVGDSIVIPLKKRTSFYGCVYSFNTTNNENRKFVTKAEDKVNVRVWRVS